MVLAMAIGLSDCSSDDPGSGADSTKPVISTAVEGAFPLSCAQVRRGETIAFKALFSDNRELGAYSINIHHNFDHHSHDTEVDACNFDAVKTPVNPWSQTLAFTIPQGLREFVAEQQIEIPSGIDTGDYHFMIQLTDEQGWATMRGISIKVVD